MTREPVQDHDLDAAITWLEEGYEAEDETLASLLRVAAYLRADLTARGRRRAVAKIMRETGCSYSTARAKLDAVTQGRTA